MTALRDAERPHRRVWHKEFRVCSIFQIPGGNMIMTKEFLDKNFVCKGDDEDWDDTAASEQGNNPADANE